MQQRDTKQRRSRRRCYGFQWFGLLLVLVVFVVLVNMNVPLWSTTNNNRVNSLWQANMISPEDQEPSKQGQLLPTNKPVDSSTTSTTNTTTTNTTSASSATNNETTLLFSFWKPQHNIVTAEDVAVGHSWKTYMYPLAPKFHKDVYIRYRSAGFGCLDTATCTAEKISKLPFQYVDYASEMILLRKLLVALEFVDHPSEADLILVPALCTTATWYFNRRGYSYGCRASQGLCRKIKPWFEDLPTHLTELHNPTNNNNNNNTDTILPHLFLASQGLHEHHKFLQQQSRSGKHLIANYGPGPLTIPTWNPLDVLQPSQWNGPLPLSERDIFVLANFGLRYNDRIHAYAELVNYTGSRTIVLSEQKDTPHPRHSFRNASSHQLKSVFVLCFPGDLPWQKRMFDAWLSVAIPVVVVRTFPYGKSYYNDRETKAFHLPTVENSYPYIAGLNYSDIVMEVEPIVLEEGRLMDFLESIPETEIEQKMANIERVRTLFLYDLEGTERDAFSVMLENIARLIGK